MLIVSPSISIPDHEIKISAIRAQGSGGQNVNKVSSAVHLRFDIIRSSLSEAHKRRLLDLKDSRINKNGVLVIKAQKFRTLEKNRCDAVGRLKEIIQLVSSTKKIRRPTKPTKSSQIKRLDSKSIQSKLKALRKNDSE